jgi:hypothetical protein
LLFINNLLIKTNNFVINRFKTIYLMLLFMCVICYLIYFRSRLKSTNSVSIDGSRLTVAVIWKEVVLQISNTFHPMNSELFLCDSDSFAASWDQVLFLAQWMSLFCRKSPTEGQDSNQRQEQAVSDTVSK